jgi:5-methyltetrahydropteroyltriglutamate--homocysteine methyltransferase
LIITARGDYVLLSNHRILTTHTGSLPRPDELTALLVREEAGELVDHDRLAELISQSVREIVRKQRDCGIDVASDGEHARISYVTYVPRRMRGFGGVSNRPIARDVLDFPDFATWYHQQYISKVRAFHAPQAIDEIHYEDLSSINAECATFAEALAAEGNPFAETFVTAASPGVIASWMLNAYYDSHERYIFALAREMKKEYDAIHAAGYILQLDCPDLAAEHTKQFWGLSDAEYLTIVDMHVAAINQTLTDIPPERVRLHLCWGNYAGPHIHDFPLEPLLPRLYQAKVGALSIEFANPRHQHEYAAFARHPLPDRMALIPGVIDTTTNFVEHEEVVAGRIEQAVRAVGDRERVLAGTECGFGTLAGFDMVVSSIAWAKLAVLVRGAGLASERLWGKQPK